MAKELLETRIEQARKEFETAVSVLKTPTLPFNAYNDERRIQAIRALCKDAGERLVKAYEETLVRAGTTGPATGSQE